MNRFPLTPRTILTPHPRTHSLRRRFRSLAIVFALSTPVACREAPPALGSTPAEARTNADHLLGSLAARFGPALHGRAYAELRPKFAKSSLVPSRIFGDRSIWTAAEDDRRTLELQGYRTERGYWIGVKPGAKAPERPAEYRQVTHLRRLDRDEFEWSGRDELALGAMRADDLGRALGTIFAAGEKHSEGILRAGYRQAFPRTTAALGRVFSLDSLLTSRAPDGATAVALSIGMHPRRLEAESPHLAKYLDKYLSPASYAIEEYDDAGARWWDARGDDNRFTLRFRVRDGSLAPLNLSPRRIPDTLRVRIDAKAKVSLFTVGVRKLIGDVTLTRLPGKKGFDARFRREPDWDLPPLVERLIDEPLRRAFEGDGALFGLALRDGTPTLVTRDFAVAVQESAIVRWFNGLGNTAVGEFRKGAEGEYDRFSGEVLSALHADVLALTSSASAR